MKHGLYCALGLYEIDGDRLKICLARYLSLVNAEQRPKSFVVEPSSGDVLLTLERYRPSEDEQKISGNWTVAGQTNDGKVVAREELLPLELYSLSFSYQECLIPNPVLDSILNWHKRGSSAELTGFLYRLDTAKQSNTIAFVSYDPNERKKYEFLGIYKFDGDRLQIAFGKDNQPPEKFESTPGSEITLLTLQKAQHKPKSGPSINPLSQPDSKQPAKR